MSDVMAVITVCNEKLVCIDYDRPVWQSKVDKDLRATPNLSHFVVDGILATLNILTLNQYEIINRFNSDDFQQTIPSNELLSARQNLYLAKGLNIEYFNDLEGDVQIHQDLARFKMPLGRIVKLSTQDLINLSK